MVSFKLFKKKREESGAPVVLDNRLKELEDYVGKVIKVYYFAHGDPKRERGYLMFPPSKEAFYIGNGTEYHIVYLEKKTARLGTLEEGLSAVALIKDETDKDIHKELYRNDEIYNKYKKWEKLPLDNLLDDTKNQKPKKRSIAPQYSKK